MPRPPLIALDTNVLLDLAKGDNTVIDCVETIRSRLKQCAFIVLPTVIQELVDISDGGGDEGKLATKAILNVLPWGFQPMHCVPVGNGIVEEIGRKLRRAGLIPAEEIHDSCIVAEAALADATILISSDRHVRDLDATQLKIELDRCDVGCPLIASPRKIVTDFFQRR
jgi:rRNA-processing protein FCF1